MAHKRIGSGTPDKKEPKKLAEDSAMKPLVRVYLKENPTSNGKEFAVIGGRLTTNGWFLLETDKFVYMLPGKNADAQHLFNTIFPGLHNQEKKQLLVIPDSSDKFGAYLGVDTEKKTYYYWDAEEYKLYVGSKPNEKKGTDPLSLDDFE